MADNLNKEQRAELKTYNENKQYKRMKREQFGSKVNGATTILGFVVILLLIVALLRVSINKEIPTLYSLLSKFSTANPVSIPFINFTQSAVGDWGIFEFLRVLLSGLMDIINVLLFFINGIISVVTYIVWFFQWVFLA